MRTAFIFFSALCASVVTQTTQTSFGGLGGEIFTALSTQQSVYTTSPNGANGVASALRVGKIQNSKFRFTSDSSSGAAGSAPSKGGQGEVASECCDGGCTFVIPDWMKQTVFGSIGMGMGVALEMVGTTLQAGTGGICGCDCLKCVAIYQKAKFISVMSDVVFYGASLLVFLGLSRAVYRSVMGMFENDDGDE